MATSEVTPATGMSGSEISAALGAALVRRDRESVKGFFDDDGVWSSHIGGTEYRGPEAAANALVDFIESFDDARFESVRREFAGDQGYSEWYFIAKTRDGEEFRFHGCDLYLFRDGKVALKNTFQKV
jgi:ketosteroid isomerase-like protein